MISRRVIIGLRMLGITCLTMAGCAQAIPNPDAAVLLFNGVGTSRNDVVAIENILREKGFEFATANSSQLNRLSESQLSRYRLLIVPGGNSITIGESLTPETTVRIRNVVHRGVNYLGICAGALLAGNANTNSLNLTSGAKFGFYAVVNNNIHKAAVPIEFPDASIVDHYWEDGPEFTGWGQVIGKYPDGTPAIVEEAVGKGWVLLCGFHPEAPENWRRGMKFSTPTSVANEYSAKLIEAAFHGIELPRF